MEAERRKEEGREPVIWKEEEKEKTGKWMIVELQELAMRKRLVH